MEASKVTVDLQASNDERIPVLEDRKGIMRKFQSKFFILTYKCTPG